MPDLNSWWAIILIALILTGAFSLGFILGQISGARIQITIKGQPDDDDDQADWWKSKRN